MDFFSRDFVYKIRSALNSEINDVDLKFYCKKIEQIAPISFEIKGESFFKDLLPKYLSQIQLNKENPIENIFYLPLFLKKFQEELSVESEIIEIVDYEFTKYQIINDPYLRDEKKIYSSLLTTVQIHPAAQILRLQYEVHSFCTNYHTEESKNKRPLLKPNILSISKNEKEKNIFAVSCNLSHTAILDELEQGMQVTKDLIQKLQTKFPNVAQREWIMALKELKENNIVIETGHLDLLP